jgi:hypothetical protein
MHSRGERNMDDVQIGSRVEFYDTMATRYEGTVMAIRDGVAFVAVLGYEFTFSVALGPLEPLFHNLNVIEAPASAA